MQTQILGVPDFFDRLKDQMTEISFNHYLEITGIAELPLDTYAAMHLLNVSHPATIANYVNDGKRNVYGEYIKLKQKRINNRPAYLLKDVLEFKKVTSYERT